MSITPNNQMINYREITSFEERKKRSDSLLLKYANKLPVILEKSSIEKYLPSIDKNKLLVSNELTVANIIQILKTNLKVNENNSLYIMVSKQNIMLSGSQSMSYIYNTYKSDDGFLYLEYCSENVFG
jgi:GABA(A) receptor-associated protein